MDRWILEPTDRNRRFPHRTAQLGRTTAPQTILVADTGSTMRVVSAGNLGNDDWSTRDEKDNYHFFCLSK